MVSLGMAAIAAYIMFHAYLAFLSPTVITLPILALVTLAACGSASTYRAIQMRRVANKYGLLSLRTNARNSIKDSTASFVVFISVLGASLGFHELDAVGGMIISLYILAVAYVAIRESSLILLDAVENPEIAAVLATALKTVEGVKGVGSIRLRVSGPYLTGIVAVFVDGNATVSETEHLRRRLLEVITATVEPIGEISIVFRAQTGR
jgi:cation diffusion facilitator family transporter